MSSSVATCAAWRAACGSSRAATSHNSRKLTCCSASARGARRQFVIAGQGDEQAAASGALQETLLFQLADAFAHGGAVDAELGGQIRLARQPVPGLQAAFEDMLLDGARDQFIGR